jgi:hypothetical protein
MGTSGTPAGLKPGATVVGMAGRMVMGGLTAHWRGVLGMAAFLFLWCGASVPRLQAQQAAPGRESPDRAASGAGVEEELRAMREEIRALREEVTGLRVELRASLASRTPNVKLQPVAMRAKQEPAAAEQETYPLENGPKYSIAGAASRFGDHESTAPARAQDEASPSDTHGSSVAELAGSVSMLQSQVAEQAQTKVESNSKMPVKVFGTILSTTFVNTGPVDWADVPSVVSSRYEAVSSTGSFSSSLRQSRVGMAVDGPTIGSMHASGYFAVDFLGGSADFQSGPLFGLPHIVYGYLRLEGAHTALEAGQDEMIMAPRHPTSLVAMSYPELFRSGSLYARAPQVRVEQELARSKAGSLRVTAGLVAPVGNYPGLDFPGSGLAEAWQRPAVQARLAWRSAESSSGNGGFELGVSGHYGRVRLGLPSATSWAGALDFDAHRGKVGLDCEFYLGQNLQSFGGGLGQPGRTLGGYVEGRLEATSRLQFNTGFGSDHLNKFDIVPVDLNRNTTVFANTIFQFTPEVAASFEYRHLVTQPFAGWLRTNEHLDVGIAYRF